jgi:hypothetical protein
MKGIPTVDQVVRDIEFELMQGAISKDDLGKAIQDVRQHLNRTRSEVSPTAGRSKDARELASKQFQIDDMFVTLLQETASKIQSLEMELRHLYRVVRDAGPDLPGIERGGRIPQAIDLSTPEGPDEDPYGWPPSVIEEAMCHTALHLEPEVRPVKVPIIGKFLSRLRYALHDLPLFYVRRLASRQVAINETYGQWILHLYRLQQHQQEQIEALITEWIALQAHLPADAPPSTSSVER